MSRSHKVLSVIVIIGFFIALIFAIVYEVNSSNFVKVKIDGKEIHYSLNEKPIIENSTTYLSLEKTVKSIGAEIMKNDDESLATVIGNEIVVDIMMDKMTVYNQSSIFSIDSTPIIAQNQIFIPGRIFLEVFGYTIKWIKGERAILATSDTEMIQTIPIYKYGEIDQDEAVYRGILHNGTPDIRGQIDYKSGKSYKGQIYESIVSGTGIMTYPDGDTYTGAFYNGARNGDATYIDSSNNTLSGTWTLGVLGKDVIVTYMNSSEYVGPIIEGMRKGKGSFSFSNGDVYVGKWEDDLFHGKGKYTFSNGSSYEGTWNKGYLNGKVNYIDSSGNRYKVKFENGKVINVERSN